MFMYSRTTDWLIFQSATSRSSTRPIYTKLSIETFRLTTGSARPFTMDVYHHVKINENQDLLYYLTLAELRLTYREGKALEEGLDRLACIIEAIEEWEFNQL